MSDKELNQDLEVLAEQERLLVFQSFNEDNAHELGELIVSRAQAANHSVTVLIRISGSPVFLRAMTETVPANFQWATRKANLTELYGQSSYRLGQENKRSNIDVISRTGLSLSDYASHGGSFPVKVEGVGLIGSVTVSGLPQREDHRLASASIAEYLKISVPQLS